MYENKGHTVGQQQSEKWIWTSIVFLKLSYTRQLANQLHWESSRVKNSKPVVLKWGPWEGPQQKEKCYFLYNLIC